MQQNVSFYFMQWLTLCCSLLHCYYFHDYIVQTIKTFDSNSNEKLHNETNITVRFAV